MLDWKSTYVLLVAEDANIGGTHHLQVVFILRWGNDHPGLVVVCYMWCRRRKKKKLTETRRSKEENGQRAAPLPNQQRLNTDRLNTHTSESGTGKRDTLVPDYIYETSSPRTPVVRLTPRRYLEAPYIHLWCPLDCPVLASRLRPRVPTQGTWLGARYACLLRYLQFFIGRSRPLIISAGPKSFCAHSFRLLWVGSYLFVCDPKSDGGCYLSFFII